MNSLFGDLRIDLATSIELARDARRRGLNAALTAHLRIIRETRAAIQAERTPNKILPARPWHARQALPRIKMSTKSSRKLNLSALCDPEQYEEVVAACLTEAQAKALPPRHLANALSLCSEVILRHYDGIAEAFEQNNGLEITLKLALAPAKDDLKISYKPVSEVKDAVTAMVPEVDPDQPEIPGMERKPRPQPQPPAAEVVVEAEIVLALPAPALALPAPDPTEEEKEAYRNGFDAGAVGDASSTNPHTYQSPEWFAWSKGWSEGRPLSDDADADAGEGEGETERPVSDDEGGSLL